MTDLTLQSNSQFSVKKRLGYLDILKGLAILGVMMVHFIQAPNGIVSLIANCGCFCPQLFFVITAFLLVRTAHKFNFRSKHDVIRFYKAKVVRILPLYFVAVILFAVINSATPLSVLSHLTLVNGFFPHYINDIIGVEWYVADLILLYLITPPVLIYVNSLKRSLIALFCSVIVAMVTHGVYLVVTHGGSSDYDISTYFKTFCFLVELPNIMVGFCIYYLTQSQSECRKWRALALYGLGVMLAIALFAVSEKCGLHVVSNRFPVSVSLGGVLLLCILFCNGQCGNNFAGRVLSTFGKYSLGIYLLHILVIKIYRATFGVECSSLIVWLVGYLAVAAVSLICGYVAEKGTNTLINRYIPTTNRH